MYPTRTIKAVIHGSTAAKNDLVPSKSPRAMDRWRSAVKKITNYSRKNDPLNPKLGLFEHHYILEQLDPKHRRGFQLSVLFREWLKEKPTDQNRNFFEWVDQVEVARNNRIPQVTYRSTDEARAEIEVIYDENASELRWARDHTLVDTTDFKGKVPGSACFSYSLNGKIYVDEHDFMHNSHASLEGGRRNRAAGMIKVRAGKIISIDNLSGHRTPGLQHLLFFVKRLPNTLFSEQAKIAFYVHAYPRLTNFFRTSRFRWVRAKIGGYFSRKYNSVVLPRDQFIEFAERKLKRERDLKPFAQMDSKGNRVEAIQFENVFAKFILHQKGSWQAPVDAINNKISEILIQYKNNLGVQKVIEDFIELNASGLLETFDKKKNRVEEFVEKVFCHDSHESDLLKLLFHIRFCEKILPQIRSIKSGKFISSSPYYAKMYTPRLFSGANRGTLTGIRRDLAPRIHRFDKTQDFGVSARETVPSELRKYYQYGRVPAKYLFPYKGTRSVIPQWVKSADLKQEDAPDFKTMTYSEEVGLYDIPFIGGTSGSMAKCISIFLTEGILSKSDIHTYAMASGAALVAAGHHSFYESSVTVRELSLNDDMPELARFRDMHYSPGYYHQYLLTDELRKSPEYQIFQMQYRGEAVQLFGATPSTDRQLGIIAETKEDDVLEVGLDTKEEKVVAPSVSAAGYHPMRLILQPEPPPQDEKYPEAESQTRLFRHAPIGSFWRDARRALEPLQRPSYVARLELDDVTWHPEVKNGDEGGFEARPVLHAESALAAPVLPMPDHEPVEDGFQPADSTKISTTIRISPTQG